MTAPAPEAGADVAVRPSLRTRLLADSRFRFLLAGGLAAALAWTLRFGLSVFIPYWAAVAVASAISLAVGFGLYRSFVFQAGNVRLGRTIAAYLAVNGVGAGLTVLVAVLAAKGLAAVGAPLAAAEAIGHAIGIALAAVFNFIAHKNWTFRGSE